MAVYFLVLFIPSLFALVYPRRRISEARLINRPLWVFFIVLLTVIAGSRHEVGADWVIYLLFVDYTVGDPLFSILRNIEPAYNLLNFIGGNYFGGIYFVNTVCGFLFAMGVSKFCMALSRPWLGMAAAMPYLFMVVSLGYTRQGVAIALSMWALTYLFRTSLTKYLILILIAALFHKSAVLMFVLPCILFFDKIKGIYRFIFGLLLLLPLFYIFNYFFGNYYRIYIEGQAISGGAFTRLFMTLCFALIYFYGRKRLSFCSRERRIWDLYATGAIFLQVLYFMIPFSTALDRVGLYLIPIQMFALSNLPELLGIRKRLKIFAVLAPLFYLSSVMFTWLFFAVHSHLWVPYKSVFFVN